MWKWPNPISFFRLIGTFLIFYFLCNPFCWALDAEHIIPLTPFWMRCESLIQRRSYCTGTIVNPHFQKFMQITGQSAASSSLAPLSPLLFVTCLNPKASSLCWLEMGTTLKHWVILSEHRLINLCTHTYTQSLTACKLHFGSLSPAHCKPTTFCISPDMLSNISLFDDGFLWMKQ